MENDLTRVLLVTKDSKVSLLIKQVLIAPLFEVTVLSDFNEARRTLVEESFKIIIADFAEGDGEDFVCDINENRASILLLIPHELFEEVSYKVESYGIMSLSKPFDTFYFYNIIKIILAVNVKMERLSSKTSALKSKLEEIRITNRAKLLLMQNKNLSEEEAHHYLEQTAMDRCIKKTDLAKEIINEYS